MQGGGTPLNIYWSLGEFLETSTPYLDEYLAHLDAFKLV